MRNRYAERKTAVLGNMKGGARQVLRPDGTWSSDPAEARLMTWDEAEKLVQELHLDAGLHGSAPFEFCEPLLVLSRDERLDDLADEVSRCLEGMREPHERDPAGRSIRLKTTGRARGVVIEFAWDRTPKYTLRRRDVATEPSVVVSDDRLRAALAELLERESDARAARRQRGRLQA